MPAALWLPIIAAGAYLVGSIPFGFLIARAKGVDIRAHGSGNIGATNVGRVLGKRVGLACFALDLAKGLGPALATSLLADHLADPAAPWVETAAPFVAATAAVLGHMFPVWLGFRGGKGVATSFGATLGLWPLLTVAAIGALVVWLAVLRLWRMVGVASCIAAIAMPPLVLAAPSIVGNLGLFSSEDTRRTLAPALVVTLLLAAIVLYKHRGNLARALAGTEPKIGRRPGEMATQGMQERGGSGESRQQRGGTGSVGS